MTVPVLAVGDPFTAAAEDAIAAWGAAWTAWTPVLTASTTNPTLGTAGTTSGRYRQIGKTVIGWGSVTFGTAATAAGAGTYAVSLPVATVNGVPLHGSVRMKCAGLYTRADLYGVSTATALTIAYTSVAVGGALVFATSAAPGAWTINDAILYSFVYESV
jgi:hypothetical protein